MRSTDSSFRIGVTTNKLKDLENKNTRMAYCKVAADLITYGLGIITGSIKGFKTSFTPEMADAGQKFLASLQTISTRDQDKALQDLLYSLFSQKRCGDANKYTLLTYSFLVLFSFTEHGSLRACNSLTQDFAKVIFFARAAIYNHITSVAAHENKGFFE